MIMRHPSKKQRLAVVEANLSVGVTAGDVSVDVLANILGFLGIQDIMRKRRVNKRWKEAAKKTIVPLTDFCVDTIENYNAMRVMTRAMPNLQQITLDRIGWGHKKYGDGDDPDEKRASQTANWPTYDIEIISNFSKLRVLEISYAGLNGRYSFLFNFPILQKLSIKCCNGLKWDLEMLAGLPVLKELVCVSNKCLAGNINSLRVLKDTLEKVTLFACQNVEGNFMDLANFPRLNELDLCYTAVTGDIRDIGEHDFSSFERLKLPKSVYGGTGYELQRISDAPDLVRAVYLLKKQRPALKYYWHGVLSEASPDWYRSLREDIEDEDTLFYIGLVQAGSRIGYRWETEYCNPCEVNWLDPEPDSENSDYGEYIKELQSINCGLGFYKGFYQPPSEEEYRRLWVQRTTR